MIRKSEDQTMLQITGVIAIIIMIVFAVLMEGLRP